MDFDKLMAEVTEKLKTRGTTFPQKVKVKKLNLATQFGIDLELPEDYPTELAEVVWKKATDKGFATIQAEIGEFYRKTLPDWYERTRK